MAAPPVVFRFIGIVFTSILYGKYCLSSDDKRTQYHRYLLPDIRLILANSTQEDRSIQRHTPLPAHCWFYSLHSVFHSQNIRGPVFDHRESSLGRKLLFRYHGSNGMRGVPLTFGFPEIHPTRIYRCSGDYSALVERRN